MDEVYDGWNMSTVVCLLHLLSHALVSFTVSIFTVCIFTVMCTLHYKYSCSSREGGREGEGEGEGGGREGYHGDYTV